jgi:hypothetical protein
LEYNSDEKFPVFSLLEQIADIFSTQVAVNVEALVEKELNKLLSVCAEKRVLEYVMLDFNLCVIVSLKNL